MSGHSSPDSAVFKVSVIGSHDNKIQNEGTLEATPTSLIYTDDQGSKFIWSYTHFQKYGSNGEKMFTIETTTDCPHGAGVYIFSTPHAPYLESVVAKHLLRQSRISPETEQLGKNSLTTPTNGRTFQRSTSLWSVQNNQFPVHSLTDDPNTSREGILEVTEQNIVFIDNSSGRRYVWPLRFLRRYGYEGSRFTFDASEKCMGGGGLFRFLSNRASEIQDLVRKQSKSYYFGSQMNLSASPSRDPVRTEDDDQPVFQRKNSFLRRARSAMDINRDLFDVVNISDDLKEVGRGTLEVTQGDLIYIDHNTEEKWRWPLRYLRRYGYDGSVFSFEAGRRCPGGEGLYAFSCPRANQIREAISLSVSGSRKPNGNDMFSSNLSLADPSLSSARHGLRRGSDLPLPRNTVLKLTPPPHSRKQIPLPRIPVPTPPRSPPLSDRCMTPRSSVSSPSFDENDTSSVSSGILTPPLSGTTSPPPKPPRNEKRRKKVKGQKKVESSKPEHMYDTVQTVQHKRSVSNEGGSPSVKLHPPKSKPIPPPKPKQEPPSLKDSPTYTDKKAKKSTKSMLKMLRRSSDIAPKEASPPPAKLDSGCGQEAGLIEGVSMYANIPPKHHSMYANIPRQNSVGSNDVSVFSTSLPASSVPQPHRGNTPPPHSHSDTLTHTNEGSLYQNIELKTPPTQPNNMYANLELKTGNVVHTPTQYTEVQIIDGCLSPGSVNTTPNRSSYQQPESESTTTVDDSPVTYQVLNFRAMNALTKLHEQRGKTEQFAEILDRHTLRQDEAKALTKGSKKKRT